MLNTYDTGCDGVSSVLEWGMSQVVSSKRPKLGLTQELANARVTDVCLLGCFYNLFTKLICCCDVYWLRALVELRTLDYETPVSNPVLRC